MLCHQYQNGFLANTFFHFIVCNPYKQCKLPGTKKDFLHWEKNDALALSGRQNRGMYRVPQIVKEIFELSLRSSFRQN